MFVKRDFSIPLLIIFCWILGIVILAACNGDQAPIAISASLQPTDTSHPNKTPTSAVTSTKTPTLIPSDTIIPTDSPTPTASLSPTSLLSPTPDDDKYRPPHGNYACDLSTIEIGSGRKLREYFSESGFETVLSDDFGTWYSIEFFRISEDELPIPKEFEERQKYLDFDLNYLMEYRIKPNVPQAKIIDQEYIQNESPILFAVLDLPGGSNIYSNNIPKDATRAVYIVIHGAYSYVFSTQYTHFSFKDDTQDKIIQDLKQDLENLYEKCEFETDLEVGKAYIPPTITPIPELTDFIPDMNIPDGLFAPEDGSKNLGEFIQEVAAQDDWILIQTFPAYSLLPLPAGWTAFGGDYTVIKFSPDDNLDDPPIFILMDGSGYIGDSRTSDEVLAEIESELATIPSVEVFEKKIVDDSKGYIFLSLIMDDGKERYLLLLVSEDEQGFYHRSFIYVYPEDWSNYYKITKAMFENWVDLSSRSLGMSLPEEFLIDN